MKFLDNVYIVFTLQCVKLRHLVKLFEILVIWLDKRSLYSGKTWELIWTRNLSYVCFHSVLLLSNGTLLITQVKNRNTGTYKCVGRGIRGSPVTLEASLLIAGVVKEILCWVWCKCNYMHWWLDCVSILWLCIHPLPHLLLLLSPAIRSVMVINFFHSHLAEAVSRFPWLLFPATIQFV